MEIYVVHFAIRTKKKSVYVEVSSFGHTWPRCPFMELCLKSCSSMLDTLTDLYRWLEIGENITSRKTGKKIKAQKLLVVYIMP